MENEKTNIAEKTVTDFVNYLGLRADRVGLSLVENLSVFFSVIFATILVLILGGIALGFIAVCLTLLLSHFLGSLLLSAATIAGVYLLAAYLVYRKRETLITDKMVVRLAKIISDVLHKKGYDEKS